MNADQLKLAAAGQNLEDLASSEIASTDEHLKQMWAGQANVLVAVRVRPLLKHDVIKKSCARVLDGKVVIIMDPATGDKQDILRANRSREKQYAFDFAFEPGASQDAVYHHTTKFLIHGVLDGYNATVFAYGQTGSGKLLFLNAYIYIYLICMYVMLFVCRFCFQERHIQ
jgi:hypothetical protein